MRPPRVTVIGAGIGGLVAAVDLAVAGCAVTVLERAATPGGKMRQVRAGGGGHRCRPDRVHHALGVRAPSLPGPARRWRTPVSLRSAELLARHAWGADERLDLFADVDRTADAIGVFAGTREASGFKAFTRRSRDIYSILKTPFLQAARPTPLGAGARSRYRPDAADQPIRDVDGRARRSIFADLRLRQLFGRYATYCGSSPYAAPATLMLVAHVEQHGVWLVEGGMHRLARALAILAAARGAAFRYGAEVASIAVDRRPG